jgi:hypothetical protein
MPDTSLAGISRSYQPKTPANWPTPEPNTIAEALDDLAADIAALPPPPAAGLGQVAVFVQQTQGTNNSVAPGTAVSYLADLPAGVVNTIGITTTGGPGAVGTAFNLPPGTYLVDFENSADAAWSLAIYQGASNTVLAVDDNTIAGASTATTWIHGRAFVTSTPAAPWIMVSPVTGTAAIPTAGTAAGKFTARISFLRLT